MKKLLTPKIRILWFILAVLNFLYGVTVFLVGSGTLSFVIWIFGALFFMLLYFLSILIRIPKDKDVFLKDQEKKPFTVNQNAYNVLACG